MLVKFEIYNDGNFWCARGIGVDIFTQGKNMDELINEIVSNLNSATNFVLLS